MRADRIGLSILISFFVHSFFVHSIADAAEPWPRHTIDASSRGADGVKLCDVNGDDRLDIATGWEEGGVVRLYLQPDAQAVKRPWPRVDAGRVSSPEDAAFVDLDGDGAIDIVSCCEGDTRSVFVHWSPTRFDQLRNSDEWSTEAFPQLRPRQAWMFCLPGDFDGQHGSDLILGSKGQYGSVTLLSAPEKPRQLNRWRVQTLRAAGWIMSLIAHDFDQDGDSDLLLSDRRGPRRGVFWLEHPGPEAVALGKPWSEHTIGGTDSEIMFLTLADLNDDGENEVIAMAQDASFRIFRRNKGFWSSERVDLPPPFKRGKGVDAADMDGDGTIDLVVTTEDGLVAWVRQRTESSSSTWEFQDVSGGIGHKFDRVELLDIDNDGDLDILTCEERVNLGVVWYENVQA